MEAPKALMNFENTRIVREVRGKINRQVNCETANINKTVTASMKQIEDIHYISSTVGIDALDENLQQIAHLRLENTEIPLSELGKLLDPPIGKSGVNHRMRKLSEIAQDLREQRGE
jgi:DNA-binding protein WhiA